MAASIFPSARSSARPSITLSLRARRAIQRRWRAPTINPRILATKARGERGLKLANVHLVETRILVRREGGWEALPYVWNAAQTEAVLARTGDAKPLELVADDGTKEAFTYVVPNENQCAGCHVVDLKTKQIAPIGTKARHLNREYSYASGTENQLLHWTKLGYLTGIADPAGAAKNADWRDVAQPLDARARAYLDINCGHCHNAKGPANTTALDLTIFASDRSVSRCLQAAGCRGPRYRRSFFRHRAGKSAGLDSAVPHALERARRDDAGAGAHAPRTLRASLLIEQWISALRGNLRYDQLESLASNSTGRRS